MSKFWKIFGGIFGSYILIYVILSFAGSYQHDPFMLGSNFGDCRWAPLGFYNSKRLSKFDNGWNKAMVYIFYPLFRLDTTCVHPNQDDPKSGE